MNNSLAKNYNLFSLIMFALPNMIMMLFLSMYTIVDGTFVSKFVGTTALSSVNMVYPMISLEMAIGIMIATGGSAIIARKMGEKREQEAKEIFTFLITVEILIGILIAVLGNIFINQIIRFLGATSSQFELCKDYAVILFAFAPCFLLQTAFQIFFVTAGKPLFGLIVTLISGITNIVLDYVFIVTLNMGIAGAALATGIGYTITAVVGIFYFIRKKNKNLYFVKPKLNKTVLLNTCINGSSEMVTNLANAVTTFLFNYTFLKYFGEDGVASITIVLYFEFVFTALFFGYSNGIAPIISFKYGEKNIVQLKKLMNSSLIFVSFCSITAFIVSKLIIGNILTIFTSVDSNVYQITISGFKYYLAAFLFMGISIFTSAWFTALSNGKVSAIVSFTRTFIFLVGAIVILPYFLGKTGVWLAVPCAEILGIFISIFYLVKYKKEYQY